MQTFKKTKSCGNCAHIQAEPISICGFCPFFYKMVLKGDNADKCVAHKFKNNYIKKEIKTK